MAFYSFFELLILLVLGLGGAPQVQGIPPLPEDPALLRVAPAETLVYYEWFGNGEPRPDSENRTERLASQPDVRQFVRKFLTAARTSIGAQAAGDAPEALAYVDFVVRILERPGCVFLSGVGASPAGIGVDGGLVVQLGEDKGGVEDVMRRLESRLASELGGQKAVREALAPIGDVTFHELPTPAEAPRLSWTVFEEYFVLAWGDKTPAQILAGLRGEPGLESRPEWSAWHAMVSVERPSVRTFVDVAALIPIFNQLSGAQTEGIMDLLGLSQVDAVIAESGLEGEGFVTNARIAARSRAGLLDLFGDRRLGVDDIATIPADATFGIALSLDVPKLIALALEIADYMDPGTSAGFEQDFLAVFRQRLGVDLMEDGLAYLGNSVTLWNAPSEGGLLFTGATAAFSLENPEAFKAGYDTFMSNLQELAPAKQVNASGRVSRNIYLESTEFRDHTIYFLNDVGSADLPFAFSWCLADNHLMFSTFPQVLKSSLARGVDVHTSIMDNTTVARNSGANAVSYLNGPEALGPVYALLQIVGQYAASALQSEGFDLNVGDLPMARSILPHLGTELSVITADDKGLSYKHTGTVPMLDPLLGIALPILGLNWFIFPF